MATIPQITPAYAGARYDLEPTLLRKFKFLLVNKYEYKLAKRPANIPARIITITFIALFPVTLGIFNDGSYSKISTVKK